MRPMTSAQAKPTDARFTLRDPGEVMTFLQRLVTWGGGAANGWHAARGCNGWKLTANAPPGEPRLIRFIPKPKTLNPEQ